MDGATRRHLKAEVSRVQLERFRKAHRIETNTRTARLRSLMLKKKRHT